MEETAPVSRQISGHVGGTATREKYGREFFVEIGRKGGKSKRKKLPPVYENPT